jgi:hypothetical protein
MLAYALYAIAWHVWRGHVSNIPGFAFLVGSLPWSQTWLGVMFEPPFKGLPGHGFITMGAVALGFGINCGLLALVFGFVRALWRPNNSFKPKPLRGSA